MLFTNPTINVRPGEELDIAAIDAAIKPNIAGLDGAPKLSQYASGASNLTYALDYPGRRLILRRPPFGTKPKSGHDMSREYKIISALARADYPVPRALFYTDDESIIGAEFYIMERVEGYLIHDKIPDEWGWDKNKTRQFGFGFFDKLIELHSIDYGRIGLEDFGRPQGYISRQILGWNERYENAWTKDADRFEDIRDWLAGNMPEDETGAAILHGDFRIDNLVLSPDNPAKIAAVLDWEISALGDPLMDLGNTLAYWIEEADPPPLKLLSRQPSMAKGMPRRAEIVKYYGDKTGLNIEGFHFYYIYGVFRLAVILQQIYYRYYHGQTKDKRFADYGRLAQILGEIARNRIKDGSI